jgi:hypothetical protein
MSGLGRRFDPSEVQPDVGPGPSDAELAEAMVAARELETLSARDVAGPTVGFEDRVMAAIAAEPAPRLLVRPRMVRGGFVGAFLLSVRDAWRIATGGGRPLAVRAQAMAFVLLVLLATGSLSVFAAVGASSLLTSPPSPTPRLPRATEAPAVLPTQTPNRLDAPTPTPSPSATDEESAEPTETPDEGPSASPTDEVGGAGQTESPKTAKPTRTPRPTETTEPEETDEPHETDEPEETPEGTDDSGSGGGGGDSRGHGGD